MTAYESSLIRESIVMLLIVTSAFISGYRVCLCVQQTKKWRKERMAAASWRMSHGRN